VLAAMGGEGKIHLRTRRERYRPGRPTPARRADDPPGIDYSHLRRLRHGASRESRRLRPDLDVAHVVVADTGPGIPQEHIDSVFEPFFTTKAPGEGTGLGLAIVAGTVEEMGGRIDAFSAPGRGAAFNIYLPLMGTAE
jgi:signal transduction histidine kinase